MKLKDGMKYCGAWRILMVLICQEKTETPRELPETVSEASKKEAIRAMTSSQITQWVLTEGRSIAH